MMLPPRTLASLLALTHAQGMEALVEVHDADELAAALDAGARVIGVNNRDLRTFDEDLATFERLAPLAPEGVTLVAESAIHTAGDAARMAEAGAHALLVGEALVRSGDVASKGERADARTAAQPGGRLVTLVKICGNRTPADVLSAAEAGADFVGICFAESSRQVGVAEAQAMVRALGDPLAAHEIAMPPPARGHAREDEREWFRHGSEVIEAYLEAKRPLTVGLFADQPIEEINEIALETELDLVQLSGDETWEDCLLVARQVIQVVHVSPLDSPSDPLRFVEPGFAIALMLDSAHGPYRGGSGRAFDWEVARIVSAELPMMLAGGLTPENVGEAIARVAPWAVDVSSGTETDGRKDPARVRDFIDAVRRQDAAA